jgi:peptidyl-tRNA hydrolase ICT1
MVKVPLDSLLPLVPRVLHQQLRSSRYATQRSQSLVIQSDDARNRATNVESCFEKFYQLLKTTADEAIPGETSPEQKDRVRKLYVRYLHSCALADVYRQKTANEARIKSKKLHSSKKSSRRGSKYDD